MRRGVDVLLAQRPLSQTKPPRSLVEPRAAEEARTVRGVQRAELRREHLENGEPECAYVRSCDVNDIHARPGRRNASTERRNLCRRHPSFEPWQVCDRRRRSSCVEEGGG